MKRCFQTVATFLKKRRNELKNLCREMKISLGKEIRKSQEMMRDKTDEDQLAKVAILQAKLQKVDHQLHFLPEFNLDLQIGFSSATGEALIQKKQEEDNILFLPFPQSLVKLREVVHQVSQRRLSRQTPSKWEEVHKAVMEECSQKYFVTLDEVKEIMDQVYQSQAGEPTITSEGLSQDKDHLIEDAEGDQDLTTKTPESKRNSSPDSQSSKDTHWEAFKFLEVFTDLGLMVCIAHGNQKNIVFHDIPRLAQLIKCVLNHEMASIISSWAEKNFNSSFVNHVTRSFKAGKIPVNLVKHLFFTQMESIEAINFAIDHLANPHFYDPKMPGSHKEAAFYVFLQTLNHSNILTLTKDAVLNADTCIIPFLATQPAVAEKPNWRQGRQLKMVCDTFSEPISMSTFSQLSVNVFESCKSLAEKIDVKPELQCFKKRCTVKFSPFHIQIDHGDSGVTVTLSVATSLIMEVQWIIILHALRSINSLLSNVSFDIFILCPNCGERDVRCFQFDWTDDGDKRQTYNMVRLKRDSCKCSIDKPTFLVENVLKSFRGPRKAPKATDPTNTRGDPETAVNIALKNVLKVIFTEEKPVDDIKALRKHPAFLTGAEIMDMMKTLRESLKDESPEKRELLERNQYLVTNQGQWKKMTKIFREDYHVPDLTERKLGDSKTHKDESIYSVKQELKEIRDIWCHRNLASCHDDMAERVSEQFKWFPMHCFMVWELITEDSPLQNFALAHLEEESKQCEAALTEAGPVEVDRLLVKIIDKESNQVKFMEYWKKDDGLEGLKKKAQKDDSDKSEEAETDGSLNVEDASKCHRENLVVGANEGSSDSEDPIETNPAENDTKYDGEDSNAAKDKLHDVLNEVFCEEEHEIPVDSIGATYLGNRPPEIPHKMKPTALKQQLVYVGPCVQEPIVIPKGEKTMLQFEELLRSTLANDKFCMDPWAIHVFTIETLPDPEPQPKPKMPPVSGLPKKLPPPSIFDMEDTDDEEEGEGFFGFFSEL